MPKKWIKTCALVLGVALVIAACSSSSSKTSTTTTAAATASTAAASPTTAAPSGAPITVGLITELSGALYFPYVAQSAKLAVAAVNAEGGINGSPVAVDICDDKSTQQGAALCATKLLVQDKVLMLSGDDGVYEAAVLPTLTSTGKIDWSTLAASLQTIQSPQAYILQPLLIQYDLIPQMLPPANKAIAYFVANNAIALGSAKAAQKFYTNATKYQVIQIPFTATDFQSVCLQAKTEGADTAVVGINPAQIPLLIQTCAQIGLTNLTWAMGSPVITPEAAQALTTLHLPSVISLAYASSAYKAIKADLDKYGAQVGGDTNIISDNSIDAWMGIRLLPKLIQGAGSTDPAKIKAWLDQQTAFDTGGWTPPIDFTKTPFPTLPRVKNITTYEGTVQNGQLVQASPTPFTFTGTNP
jgi:ABC-type branched-subunit amino acid transport system substrate-binding protein